MGEKVQKCGVKRQDGFLYYIDKAGDVSGQDGSRRQKGGKPEKVAKVGVKKEAGFCITSTRPGHREGEWSTPKKKEITFLLLKPKPPPWITGAVFIAGFLYIAYAAAGKERRLNRILAALPACCSPSPRRPAGRRRCGHKLFRLARRLCQADAAACKAGLRAGSSRRKPAPAPAPEAAERLSADRAVDAIMIAHPAGGFEVPAFWDAIRRRRTWTAVLREHGPPVHLQRPWPRWNGRGSSYPAPRWP